MGIHIVLDCADPNSLAEFWAKALGYDILGFKEQWGLLKGPNGEILILQRVPESKSVKNRMHIDITAPDIEAKASELEGLGARRLRDAPIEEVGGRWIPMADPEGNEFCVCRE